MTETPLSPAPLVSTVALYRRLAPSLAQQLSHQLHYLGLRNSSELIWALLTGLQHFAIEQGVTLSADFPAAWPEALYHLRAARSDDDWDGLLPQTATAPRAAAHKHRLGAAKVLQMLEACETAMSSSPRVAVGLGTWLVTAVVIAHSGPLDADITLEELSSAL